MADKKPKQREGYTDQVNLPITPDARVFNYDELARVTTVLQIAEQESNCLDTHNRHHHTLSRLIAREIVDNRFFGKQAAVDSYVDFDSIVYPHCSTISQLRFFHMSGWRCRCSTARTLTSLGSARKYTPKGKRRRRARRTSLSNRGNSSGFCWIR